MTTGTTHEEQHRLLAAAWTATYMWSDVVTRCADHVLDSTDLTTVEHMGEAATLTVALRNVLRAARVARPLATGQDHDRITAAIQAFERWLPQAKDARDVLEHFDDYAAGTGRIQENDRKRGRTITFYPPGYERGASDYYLRVGPLRVSVTAAKRAAAELAAAVALIQLPSRIPPPGALRCSQVHYLGPGNRDEVHAIHDGDKHLSVGDTVPFPGIWEGQTDKTRPAVAMSSRASRSISRISWCTPPSTGRRPDSALPIAGSFQRKATTQMARPG